jgi:hypothetical protein
MTLIRPGQYMLHYGFGNFNTTLAREKKYKNREREKTMTHWLSNEWPSTNTLYRAECYMYTYIVSDKFRLFIFAVRFKMILVGGIVVTQICSVNTLCDGICIGYPWVLETLVCSCTLGGIGV